MSYIAPASRQELTDGEEVFHLVEELLGFVPNALLILGRRPKILSALGGLIRAVMKQGQIDSALKMLVAEVASRSAGCHYCQAHTAVGAQRKGAPTEKIRAVWNFESSEQFTGAERAALRLARDAASTPNATERSHFDELGSYFRDEEILEIVAVISLFGWFNRWNDTLATDLEQSPLAFASQHLSGVGWDPGKHGDAV